MERVSSAHGIVMNLYGLASSQMAVGDRISCLMIVLATVVMLSSLSQSAFLALL